MRCEVIDPRLLEVLVCPVSKAPLQLAPEQLVPLRNELWCPASGLAYPIRDGIPVLLAEAGRSLTDAEREAFSR